MSRSRQSNQQQMMALATEEQIIEKPPSKCMRFLHYVWKFCSCVFSHVLLVSLVVSYCILGAFTFEHLEADNERKVKSSIADIRGNVTEDIWKLTKAEWVLHQDNWTNVVIKKLKDFETDILTSMKQKGWDGNEDPDSIQWTFAGALFFSIIVITTIGYGHIAPKTQMGKVVTIFYAILGIPLMLLCLSNIGDVMATSFRFLYWRVCCYVCTRKPKRKRHRSRGSSRYPSGRSSSRTRSSTKKQGRYSQKSADSGFATTIYSDDLPPHSYSDTDLRYQEETDFPHRTKNLRISQISRFSDSITNPQIGYARSSRGRGRGHEPISGRGLHRGRPTLPHSQRLAPARHNLTPSPRDSATERRYERSSSEARAYMLREFNDRPTTRSSMGFGKYTAEVDYPMNRGKSLQSPFDLDFEDEKFTPRSKSLPRQPRKDFFYEDDIRTGAVHKRDRSPRFDTEPRDRDYRINRDCYDSRDYKSNRDIFNVRDFMDVEMTRLDREELERDFNSLRDQKFRYGLHADDLPNKRQRYKRSPEPGREIGRDEKIVPQDRKNRNRYDIYNDDEFEGNPYYDEETENCASETETAIQRAAKQRRKERLNTPSARIMSPMGISVHRQAKYMEDFDIEYAYEDGLYQSSKSQIKPVPIWLCVFLVISYIIAGAFLFSHWEHWSFLDSAYFCFITLTTIGFGDFVPAQGVKANSEISIALCSLYLLFGIALLAMSFNLVQEEVIANVRSVAKRLGIIKPELGEESDED